MESQIIRKLAIVAIGLAIFSGVEIFAKGSIKKEYWAIRNTNLHELGPIQRVKHHKAMTRILVRLGALEKKPSFYGGSKFSYQKILNDLTETVIPFCHADGSNEHCLFGGWVSARSGRCNTPYSANGVAAAAQLGTSQYDSGAYCNSKKQFRCNPLVFGPGIDSSLAGEGYENINGLANNGSPYSAGICVDISSGFNGLSKKCQEASDHLDKVRKNNGQEPWRESDFFNAERAEEFRALQGVIADRCEANRESINADGMCDSLENSISLTATVARAGNLNGINLKQVLPHCVQEGQGAEGSGACKRSDDESLSNLYGALDKLQEMSDCKFGRVQAADHATGSVEAFAFSACPLSIEGQLASGFNSEQKVAVNLRGRDGAFAGSLNVTLSPSMTQEEIYSQFNVESKDFKDACLLAAKTSCNHPAENSRGSTVTKALSELSAQTYTKINQGARNNNYETQASCGFDSVEIGVASGESQSVQILDGAPESGTSAHCNVQFTGELKDQLESDNFRNQAINTTIQIVKGGRVMMIPLSLDSASVSSVTQSVKGTKGFDEFCQGRSGATAEELAKIEKEEVQNVETMRKKFGLSNDQHLTTQQREALVLLQGVEGLSVEIDEFGGMTFKHPDIASVSDQLESLFPGIYVNREGGNSARLFPKPDVRVEFLAARSSTDFTEEERKILTDIEGTTRDDSVEFFSGLTRDGDGNVVFLTNGAKPLSPEKIQSLERKLGGKIIAPHQDANDPAAIRSYVIRAPAAVEAGGLPENITRNLSAALDRGRQQVMNNSNMKRQVAKGEGRFEVSVAEPVATEDGRVSISYTLDLEGSVANRINMINLYTSDLKREATRSGCQVTPKSGGRIKKQGSFQIICPAQK